MKTIKFTWWKTFPKSVEIGQFRINNTLLFCSLQVFLFQIPTAWEFKPAFLLRISHDESSSLSIHPLWLPQNHQHHGLGLFIFKNIVIFLLIYSYLNEPPKRFVNSVYPLRFHHKDQKLNSRQGTSSWNFLSFETFRKIVFHGLRIFVKFVTKNINFQISK